MGGQCGRVGACLWRCYRPPRAHSIAPQSPEAASPTAARLTSTWTLHTLARSLDAAAELKREVTRLRTEVMTVQTSLREALNSLNVKLVENKTLAEHVKELGETAMGAQAALHAREAELVLSRRETAEALDEVARQREQMARQGSAAEMALVRAREAEGALRRSELDAKAAMAKLKAQCDTRVAQLDVEIGHLTASVQKLREELHDCREALSEAMSSVGELSGAKMSLGERVRALGRKYRTARASLSYLGREMQQAVATLERVTRAKDESDGASAREMAKWRPGCSRGEKPARERRSTDHATLTMCSHVVACATAHSRPGAPRWRCKRPCGGRGGQAPWRACNARRGGTQLASGAARSRERHDALSRHPQCGAGAHSTRSSTGSAEHPPSNVAA